MILGPITSIYVARNVPFPPLSHILPGLQLSLTSYMDPKRMRGSESITRTRGQHEWLVG